MDYKDISLIFAVGSNGEFGYQNKLPWPRLRSDMQHFKEKTTKIPFQTDPHSPITRNAVIMGRKSWESLPDFARPLTGRLNIVLTSDPSLSENTKDVIFVHSLDMAIEIVDTDPSVHSAFVIGGVSVINTFVTLHSKRCRSAYVTVVSGTYEADTFLSIDFILHSRRWFQQYGTPFFDFENHLSFAIYEYFHAGHDPILWNKKNQ